VTALYGSVLADLATHIRTSRQFARRAVAGASVAFTSEKIGQSVYMDARAGLSIEQAIVIDPRWTVFEENTIAAPPQCPLASACSSACKTIADQTKTNNAGCLSALSYHRSNAWTVMRMRIDIKRCGKFATSGLSHFGARV
jgi:hypothetical protein